MKRAITALAVGLLLCAQLPASDDVTFGDPKLEKAVQAQLRTTSPITTDDMARLEFLCIDSASMANLNGLEAATNLVSLKLYNSNVGDYSAIAHLGSLRELSIRNCNFADVKPVASLMRLEYLTLTHDHIEDAGALAKCTSVTWLDISDNDVRDVSVMAGLNRLASLNLSNNPLDAGSAESRLAAVREANPGVSIASGPREEADAPIQERLTAMAKFANFANGPCSRKSEGVTRPQLADVPSDVLGAMNALERDKDGEYEADVALFLLRYAIEMDPLYRPSTLLSRDNPHPVVAAFISEHPTESFGDEIVLMSVGKWICTNRASFGPSAMLDKAIGEYEVILTGMEKGEL